MFSEVDILVGAFCRTPSKDHADLEVCNLANHLLYWAAGTLNNNKCYQLGFNVRWCSKIYSLHTGLLGLLGRALLPRCYSIGRRKSC